MKEKLTPTHSPKQPLTIIPLNNDDHDRHGMNRHLSPMWKTQLQLISPFLSHYHLRSMSDSHCHTYFLVVLPSIQLMPYVYNINLLTYRIRMCELSSSITNHALITIIFPSECVASQSLCTPFDKFDNHEDRELKSMFPLSLPHTLSSILYITPFIAVRRKIS